MNNYPNPPHPSIPPPPPPPPMQHMDLEQHVGMVQPRMDGFDDDLAKMGPPNFAIQPPLIPHQPMSVPPPPPAGMVPPMGMPHPMNMPVPGMIQSMNVQNVPVKQSIDPYLAAEISSIVHTLSTSQLIYVLASLKKFLKHAPSEARRFLINNPQLTYALLHTQFILGEHDETILPLSKMDNEISHVNKLERSMHLKPFHNLYEDPPRSSDKISPDVYSKMKPYGGPEKAPVQHSMPEMPKYEANMYKDDQYRNKKRESSKNKEATQADIDEIVNQGIYPASAALVDEVIKNPEILTNIQRATREEMNSWPLEQKQQVLSIKIALHMRGISVNL